MKARMAGLANEIMRCTMKCQNKIISRSYMITQKELKSKLELKGDIQSITLWSGLSPADELDGKSHDKDEYEIVTHEVDDE